MRARITGPDGLDVTLDCDRAVYANADCVVVLEPIQLSSGHAIAILKPHRSDVTDPSVTDEEHRGLIGAVQRVARAMRAALGCERVYVASLCDVVQRLHYHLIPGGCERRATKHGGMHRRSGWPPCFWPSPNDRGANACSSWWS